MVADEQLEAVRRGESSMKYEAKITRHDEVGDVKMSLVETARYVASGYGI